MLANVHLYIYDEGALEARVETIQIDVLSVTHLSYCADFLMRYDMDGVPRGNCAAHVNFEYA